MNQPFANPQAVMQRAIDLARRGQGFVEPNPMVGAVIVDDALSLLGEGHHERFGGPHAEINALAAAGGRAKGATLFVTLEPCCHQGKTGPCTKALIEARIRKVVIALGDPSPHSDGSGIDELRAAGIDVEIGLLGEEATRLTAPFVKRLTTGLPYIHAKWAMSLDGKIATRSGSSRWISNEASRRKAHALRGRMDAILIGRATAQADDPLLTARPAGARVPVRIVADSHAQLRVDSQLVKTLDEAPVIVAATETADAASVDRLQQAGIEVIQFPHTHQQTPGHEKWLDLRALFSELGRRGMTNVLVEGGGQLLGALLDLDLIDEVHVFVAAKLIGGTDAVTPVAGRGLTEVPEMPQLDEPLIEIIDGDVYIHGPLRR